MTLTSLMAVIVLSGGAQASFGFEDLKSLVVNKTSVVDTLENLPPEMRANFVLMYHSRSLQSASPEKPRAILFNDDSSLVISFTEEHRGANCFEVMTFDPKEARFDVKTISFANGTAVVNEHPQNCFGCHGQIENDLHPVWDPGLIWRGAYGSHDDSFSDPATLDESRAYAQFFDHASAAYRSLDLTRKIGAGDRHMIENRPNLRLGLLLMRQQAKRVARLIGPGRLQKLCQSQGSTFDLVPNLTRFMKPIYGDVFTQDFLKTEGPGLAEVMELVEQAGLNTDEVSLTIERRTHAVFDGAAPFKDLLFAELARREYAGHLTETSLAQSPLRLKSSPALRSIESIGNPLKRESVRDVCQSVQRL